MTNRERIRQRLLAAARPAYRPSGAATPSEIPPGLSARVAAQWAAQGRVPRLVDLWERLCWWGASIAVGMCMLAVVEHGLAPAPTSFDMLFAEPQTEFDPF